MGGGQVKTGCYLSANPMMGHFPFSLKSLTTTRSYFLFLELQVYGSIFLLLLLRTAEAFDC